MPTPIPLRRFAFLALTAAFAPSPAANAQEGPAGRSGFALTVYSSADPASFDPKASAKMRQDDPNFQLPGYGVVRETRSITLKQGVNSVRFTDVAAGIDPTTVSFASVTDPKGTSVVEQDYEFDLVGGDKLLQKYLGESIYVQPKGQAGFSATLLAADPGSLVLRDREESGGRIRIVPRVPDPAEIILPTLPSGLITRPTLVWKVAAEKAGPHDVRVSYQTDGITWRADYNLVVDKNAPKADLNAWVSILNESGASYPDATLKLVAGDVRRVQPPQYRNNMMRAPMAAPAPMAPPGFEEKAFFEYHLYTLGRKTSLGNRSTKQIELFPAKVGVPVERTYVYYGQPENVRGFASPQPVQDRNFGTESNKKVDLYLSLKNAEAAGLGLPLPAGRVRVYQKDDADAALEFVGEDAIDHTPKGEEIRVKLGSAFDVTAERKQTDYRVNTALHWITESFEIQVRNAKTEPVRVIVKENLLRWANWAVTASSPKFEKQDARTIHFPLDVPASGEAKVTYTVRYTW